jgi:hypothetical protein
MPDGERSPFVPVFGVVSRTRRQLMAGQLDQSVAEGGFLKPSEVARIFGVTVRTVANWCDQGRLPCVITPAGHRRIPLAGLHISGLVPAAQMAM